MNGLLDRGQGPQSFFSRTFASICLAWLGRHCAAGTPGITVESIAAVCHA
jgi:hypothetical protein